jgi:small GTP-binding protein
LNGKKEDTLMRGTLRRQFKICLIGDGFVGKTSIRLKYLKGGFKRSYIPTLGVDFAQKSIQYDDVPTNLVIWDIAGQSLFQNLRKRYYDGASGIVLVYSVIDKVAFGNAAKWLEEAHGFVKKLPPLIIIGNKIDLRENTPPEETVSTQEGRDFAQNISNILNTRAVFIETSALTGENIDRSFEALVEMMVEELEKRRPGYVPKDTTPSPEAAPGTLIDLSKPDEPAADEPVVASTEEQATIPVNEEPVVTSTEEQDTMPAGEEPVVAESSEPHVSETSTEPLVSETPTEEPIVTNTTSKPEATQHTELDSLSPELEVVSTAKTIPIDPVTTLHSDSEYLQEEQIGSAMGDLVRLREELRVAEEDLAKAMSELETTMLNLKNIIHVKKIMYSHLQDQLKTTRQEWADAYDQYVQSEQRKSSELDSRSRQIEDIRKRIDKIGKKIRTRVSDLDMKKITD